MAIGTETDETESMAVLSLTIGEVLVCVRGTTPLVFNTMSEKARLQLLVPRSRRTLAERAESPKHEPMTEYRNSVYRARDEDDSPTRLVFPSSGFKRAMTTAALDLPGMRKTQIGRVVRVMEQHVPIWGIPQIYMTMVRSADIKRTPDIRTRAILREWCSIIRIQHVLPLIKQDTVGRLIAAAGILVGIGDGRQERGTLSYGLFEAVDLNDAAVNKLMQRGDRRVQDLALADPAPYDIETERLLALYEIEKQRQKAAPIVRQRTTETETINEGDRDVA